MVSVDSMGLRETITGVESLITDLQVTRVFLLCDYIEHLHHFINAILLSYHYTPEKDQLDRLQLQVEDMKARLEVIEESLSLTPGGPLARGFEQIFSIAN